MNPRFLLVLSCVIIGSTFARAHLPPLGAPQEPKPQDQNPPAQGLPPLGGPAEQKPGASPAGTLSVDAANADLKLARAANAEKRYADAEALMRKDTALKPSMLQLWVELGTAQLGLKKYEEAEISFKAALSNGEAAQRQAPAGGFYTEGKGTIAHVAVTTSAPPPVGKTMPKSRAPRWRAWESFTSIRPRFPKGKMPWTGRRPRFRRRLR